MTRHRNGCDVIRRYIELARRALPAKITSPAWSSVGVCPARERLISVRSCCPACPPFAFAPTSCANNCISIGELESFRIGCRPKDYTIRVITSQTYETLARFATIALTAGYDVIVDATFLHRADRSIAANGSRKPVRQDLQSSIVPPTTGYWPSASRKRHASGSDASEADLAVLDWQRGNLESLTTEEQRHTLTVDTGRHSAVR